MMLLYLLGKTIHAGKVSFYIISLIFVIFGHMEVLNQLINAVDQNPETILVMRQQTEQRLPSHQHDKAQLLLVYGGIAYLQTNERDFYIPSNHYIWIPKNYPHNLMFNTQDLYIINIYFPDGRSSGFYDELGIYPVSKLLSEMLAFSETWQGDYYQGSWEFEFMTTLKKLLSKENLKKFSIQLPTTDDQRLNAIIDNLRNRLNENLSLEETAKLSGMSVRSLTRLFQTKLRTTFVQHVKMLRIIRAMELIKDSDLNMTEIAYEVGYSNIAAFSNNFRQLTNMRPTQFKAQRIFQKSALIPFQKD
ncbi:helix-turn-helix domain-containing protein [Olivibacter sp. LS-1]|nr:helix-turn-helix domain-containing protein [Olivibacter sp. LS-1]